MSDTMSIHQTIYDTLDKTSDEVAELIGSGDPDNVGRRQDRMRLFLKDHKWSEESYKAWMRDGMWTPDKPARGAGDLVAKVTNKIGVKGCGGCGSRQRLLNKIFPVKEL